jgi:O-antigen/teichoic acid export membrane protein
VVKILTPTKVYFRDAFLYTIATMMIPLAGFILLPFFTAILSPEEYGIMTTVHALVGFLQLFMVLSLHGAITRLYYDFQKEKERQKRYLGSILCFVLLFSIGLSILLWLAKPVVGHFLFAAIPIDPYYDYLVGLSMLAAFNSIPTTILRIKERAATFVLIHVIKSGLVIMLSFYFLLSIKMGASSYLLAVLLTSIVTFLLSIWLIRKDIVITFSGVFIKSSLIYSLPLLPHVLSNWFITTSDRVILEKFVSLELLGIYALAVQMATIVRMFFIGINSAFVPKYNDLMSKGKENEAEKISKMFSFMIVSIGVLSLIASPYLLAFLATPEYSGATYYTVALLGVEIIFGMNYIFTAKIAFAKQTGKMSISSGLAAILNILINFILIPVIGLWGAVISTYLAEVTRTLLNIRWMRKL